MGSEMKSVIRPLPKYSPDYKPGAAPPHTEIVLYEDNTKSAAGQRSQMLRYSSRLISNRCLSQVYVPIIVVCHRPGVSDMSAKGIACLQKHKAVYLLQIDKIYVIM